MQNNKKNLSAFEYLHYWIIYEYFLCLNNGFNKVEASISIASKLYQKGSYQAKNICAWVKYWIENKSLLISKQGCYKKIKSLIDDEDLIDSSLRFIRQSGGKTTSKDYWQFI